MLFFSEIKSTCHLFTVLPNTDLFVPNIKILRSLYQEVITSLTFYSRKHFRSQRVSSIAAKSLLHRWI